MNVKIIFNSNVEFKVNVWGEGIEQYEQMKTSEC